MQPKMILNELDKTTELLQTAKAIKKQLNNTVDRVQEDLEGTKAKKDFVSFCVYSEALEHIKDAKTLIETTITK